MVSTTTFTLIQTLGTLSPQYGAVFYAQEIGQLTLFSVTATDVTVTSNSGFVNGKGRFLFADMS